MRLKRLLKLFLFLSVLGSIALIIYCLHLSNLIEDRFNGRRWLIPSRIYSDTTILYPGQRIHRKLFEEKLSSLGYQTVSHALTRKGEQRFMDSGLEIFLHDLNAPSLKRPGFKVRIKFDQDRIESIAHVDRHEPVPILELEPEEVMCYFGSKREQRRLISIDNVPQHLIYAVLAAEDSRFYQHNGMDPRAVLRALYTNLRHLAIRQGGSTITQQLAKNYFLTPQKTFTRKLKELLMSLTMEAIYDKNEILEIYLNEIYLGQKGSVSVNGVGEAARFYFGKSANNLSTAEAATIAGLIRSPNYYSPYHHRAHSLIRRNTVLRYMHENGWISDKGLRAALSEPINTVGYKAYGKKAPYFIDFLSLQLKELYPQETLTSQGLNVYTTLDTQVQAAAEKALSEGLARLEKAHPALDRSASDDKLQGAIIVMQPKTGYVLAMVGGRNYGFTQFNRITQARRQPGSAFKPFVFLSALDEFTPASQLSNEPRPYDVDGKIWEPQNYVNIPEKRVSLRTALAKSVNLATVDLAVRLGVEKIVQTAEQFRFSTSLRPYPSIALGTSEVIPLELARAYCAFAADGLLPYPLMLRSVEDENGQILERRHMDIVRVFSPEKAYMMTSLLRSVTEEGTARSIKNMGISFPVAGKTGTTNNFRDAWFIGYTPDILALVWVGFDDGSSIVATGSSAALPIWADLVNAMPQHISGDWFKMPAGVVKRRICPESGELALKYRCPESREEIFLAKNAPGKSCSVHGQADRVKHLIRRITDFFSNF